MEIILGILVLYLLSLIIDNIEVVFFIALGVGLFLLIAWAIRNRENTTSKTDKCIMGHCQYCNLGKAKQAGYSADYCYCKHYADYLQIKSECSFYKSKGCANGMCDYADFGQAKQEGRGKNACYCNRLNQYVTARESCDLYADEKTREILKSLSEH